MTPERPKYRATRMTFADFQASTDVTKTARRSADRIISEARAIAEQVNAELDRREAEMNARIQGMTDDELRQFIDTQALTSSAKAMANMMFEANLIRAEFETLYPWLVPLVESCLSKVIGQLDDDTLVARMVAQGVSEMQAEHALTLRVHSTDHARLLGIAEKWPDAFTAVKVIVPDASIPSGEMVLEGEAGLIQLGFDGVMSAVVANLESALQEMLS
ncbi:MAG: hypothetical protein ABJM43_19725 [Paracoccaceae bacterium]